MREIIFKIIGNKEAFSIQHQILNAALFSGVLLSIITPISNYYLGLNSFVIIFSIFSFLVFTGLYLHSISKKNVHLTTRVGFIYLLFIFFPIYWFINGGSQGGFQYFSVVILLMLLTINPKKKSVFLTLFFLTTISILCLEYFFPELVHNYPTRTDRYMDLIIAYTLVYTVVIIVVGIFFKLYNQAITTLTKQKGEIQAAKKELEIANKELKKTNQTKDKFFSIIAHDLKSPFNSLLGFSNLLDEKFDEFNSEEQKKIIGIIHTGIQNTFKLLDNLLIWSRTQNGSIGFNPEEENLFLLSTEIIDIIQISAKRKSINIQTEIPQHILINTDKYMFTTILMNLLTNAVKFTPKNGEIAVKAEQISNAFIQISIIDNGIGISKERQSLLFDISHAISTKGTENETGTGLGLFLCKEFTEKHGGEIWVESETNKGSKFIFTIPANSKK